MYCMGNPYLYCIRVPDVAAATANQNWLKDAGAIYSLNCNAAGISDVSAVSSVLFPNPASDELTFTGLQINAEWRIYNTLGQLLLSGKVNSSDAKTVNIQALSSGVYSVKITHNSQFHTFKLVKN